MAVFLWTATPSGSNRFVTNLVGRCPIGNVVQIWPQNQIEEINVVSLRQQVARNFVAIVSLIVALSALGYNTWRTEKSEENRNLREVSINILLKLGELQAVVFQLHYDHNLVTGNPRIGWAYVLTIDDLASILPAPVGAQSDHLLAVWQHNWMKLGKENSSVESITKAMDSLREDVLQVIVSLK